MIYYAVCHGGRWCTTMVSSAPALGYKHGLISYADEKPREHLLWASHMFHGVVLDSGAFSAYSRGATIDLEAYIEFCKSIGHLCDFYANLDVILDHEGSERNQRRMEKAGLTPLPTFHLGGPWSALTALCDEYDHFAIGRGSVGQSTAGAMKYLAYAWKLITAHKRWPLKVHGWAMSDPRIMETFPWHSVDSTTWLAGERFGNATFRGRGRYPVTRPRLKCDVLRRPRTHGGNLMRMRETARALQSYQDYVTKLWAGRGVAWDDRLPSEGDRYAIDAGV